MSLDVPGAMRCVARGLIVDLLLLVLRLRLHHSDVLPDGMAPYFLRSDTGPKYLLNGQSNTPLCRNVNSDGNFSISVIAGNGPKSKYPSFIRSKEAFKSGPFVEGKMIRFDSTHTLFRVIEGFFDFEVQEADGNVHKETISANESIMVSAGNAFRYSVSSAYGRMYSFAGKGSGLEEVFIKLGRVAKKNEMVGETDDEEVSIEDLNAAVKAVGAEFV